MFHIRMRKKSKEVLKDISFQFEKEKYMRLQENQAEEKQRCYHCYLD